MSTDAASWEPRWPRGTAVLVCVVAAMVLLWPLLAGKTLFGGGSSDMLGAGYAFRLFGAAEFMATGTIPQWNPYLFGGMPFVAAMHGDIFYPTAWLRWVLPADLAITWGMVAHFVLAGYLTFCLGRALGLTWTGAIVAGVAYQLSGIVASQVSPGHDGKLYVSALAPGAFLCLWHAIHNGRAAWFGWLAVTIGLCVLSPHYQMTYFLLIALGGWTLYLAFWDPARAAVRHRWTDLGLAAAAVLVGLGLAGLQILPFLEYIPYSPRAAGGPNTGWQYANLFSMPPEEIVTFLLPQFNGVLENYWGRNPFKLHTEYLGAVTVILALLAWGDRERRRLLVVLGVIGAVFLLLAFAGHTPFYRPWYEFMPMMKKLRAMGMVIFLVALPVAVMAGMGLDRVLRGTATLRAVGWTTGALGALALLGVAGILQVVAEGMAIEPRMEAVQANAAALRLGSVRLLVVVLLTAAALWAVVGNKLRGGLAATVMVAVMVADLWSVDRRFFDFSPRAAELFREDEVTTHLRGVTPPYRVYDLQGVYLSSVLMAYRIPNALGYHGNELRYYDEIGGKDQGWAGLRTRNLLDLLALRFVLLPDTASLPGWHHVAGPTTNAFGYPVVLYEQDTVPAYARVVASAATVPETQVAPAVVNPRFSVRSLVLYPDTASVTPAPLVQPLPVSGVSATVTQWSPGRMTVQLAGANPAPSYLVVSENWYPDWRATVDGSETQVLRGNHSLLSVVVPPGAREVSLWFESTAYARGKVLTAVSLVLALGLLLAPRFLTRRSAGV